MILCIFWKKNCCIWLKFLYIYIYIILCKSIMKLPKNTISFIITVIWTIFRDFFLLNSNIPFFLYCLRILIKISNLLSCLAPNLLENIVVCSWNSNLALCYSYCNLFLAYISIHLFLDSFLYKFYFMIFTIWSKWFCIFFFWLFKRLSCFISSVLVVFCFT